MQPVYSTNAALNSGLGWVDPSRLTGDYFVDILLTFRSLTVVDESTVFSRSATSPAQGRASG